jgi:hypothetical protein
MPLDFDTWHRTKGQYEPRIATLPYDTLKEVWTLAYAEGCNEGEEVGYPKGFDAGKEENLRELEQAKRESIAHLVIINKIKEILK